VNITQNYNSKIFLTIDNLDKYKGSFIATDCISMHGTIFIDLRIQPSIYCYNTREGGNYINLIESMNNCADVSNITIYINGSYSVNCYPTIISWKLNSTFLSILISNECKYDATNLIIGLSVGLFVIVLMILAIGVTVYYDKIRPNLKFLKTKYTQMRT